jgi:putative FmdB family regulatory protein
MVLYDFLCDKCGKEFEDLVKHASDARCPYCGSAEVTKQLSSFAIGSGRRESPPVGGCGTGFCGGGGCGIG